MTDDQTNDAALPDEAAPVTDPVAPAPPTYPDTPVGMLQQQLDQLTAESSATRAAAAQYLARADAADARAKLVQAAIDSLSATS